MRPFDEAVMVQCQACDYENPRETKFCLECGARLGAAGRRQAEGEFSRALRTARSKAEDRLRRAGVHNLHNPAENRNTSGGPGNGSADE